MVKISELPSDHKKQTFEKLEVDLKKALNSKVVQHSDMIEAMLIFIDEIKKLKNVSQLMTKNYIYVILSSETLVIYGCFKKKDSAEAYMKNCTNEYLFVKELEII